MGLRPRSDPLRHVRSWLPTPFSWYFGGVSQVSVASVSDLERWLLGCHYMSDRSLFGQEDYWQHPGELERIRGVQDLFRVG